MTTGGGSTPCFPNHGVNIYGVNHEDAAMLSNLEAANPSSGSDVSHSTSLLYNLSFLKDKYHQVESLVSTIFISPTNHTESTAVALASMGTLIQEIIITASSMMHTCQQMALGATPTNNNIKLPDGGRNRAIQVGEERVQGFYSGDTFNWYAENYTTCDTNNNSNYNMMEVVERKEIFLPPEKNEEGLELGFSPKNGYDIVELKAADLLAKYTHYCQVCGKGFKRDANLRMHMRAHGDEYKSSAALSNPTKKSESLSGNGEIMAKLARKYSCPQEGCRWNRKHEKFQPLKSMICVKNHYKRCHCPKMYVCNRCNRKQFSVLSDLRTHEKHCGDLKWQCSCGTTFSRKDKLMGHVALFVGHTPVASNSSTKIGIIN